MQPIPNAETISPLFPNSLFFVNIIFFVFDFCLQSYSNLQVFILQKILLIKTFFPKRDLKRADLLIIIYR